MLRLITDTPGLAQFDFPRLAFRGFWNSASNLIQARWVDNLPSLSNLFSFSFGSVWDASIGRDRYCVQPDQPWL